MTASWCQRVCSLGDHSQQQVFLILAAGIHQITGLHQLISCRSFDPTERSDSILMTTADPEMKAVRAERNTLQQVSSGMTCQLTDQVMEVAGEALRRGRWRTHTHMLSLQVLISPSHTNCNLEQTPPSDQTSYSSNRSHHGSTETSLKSESVHFPMGTNKLILGLILNNTVQSMT